MTTTHFSAYFAAFARSSHTSALEEAFQQLVDFARCHTVDDIDELVMSGRFQTEFPELDERKDSEWERWDDLSRATPGNRRNAVLAEGHDSYLTDVPDPTSRDSK